MLFRRKKNRAWRCLGWKSYSNVSIVCILMLFRRIDKNHAWNCPGWKSCSNVSILCILMLFGSSDKKHVWRCPGWKSCSNVSVVCILMWFRRREKFMLEGALRVTHVLMLVLCSFWCGSEVEKKMLVFTSCKRQKHLVIYRDITPLFIVTSTWDVPSATHIDLYCAIRPAVHSPNHVFLYRPICWYQSSPIAVTPTKWYLIVVALRFYHSVDILYGFHGQT